VLIALDKSVDVCHMSQLLLFIRGTDNHFDITEELASVHGMYEATKGEGMFKKLE
jgi:hypothetical protein